jgi:hypothetical protein
MRGLSAASGRQYLRCCETRADAWMGPADGVELPLAGTEVRECCQVTSIPWGFQIFVCWFNPFHRTSTAKREDDLQQLKVYVEAGR